jgi:peptide chain release factor 1
LVSIINFVCGGVFELQLLDSREGIVVFRVSGKNAEKTFAHEAGGHRVQRVPPTEKRGRVHTSTITVAVLPEVDNIKLDIPGKDLEWKTCRSSGAGGQHTNKTDSAVALKHLPSGLIVRVESRSQYQNKQDALQILKNKLSLIQREQSRLSRDANRKEQMGTGMRGDKIRTIRQQDDQVHDHQLNKRISYKDYLRGNWDDLIG